MNLADIENFDDSPLGQRNSQPRVRALVLVLLCVGVWACQPAEQATSRASSPLPPAPTSDAVLLGSFAAPPYEFRLQLPHDRRATTSIQVQLIAGERVLDTYLLPGEAAREYYPDIVKETVSSGWADRGLDAWRTGGGDAVVTTTARVVEMARGVSGLLVSQRIGFEHPANVHVLLLPQQNDLVPAWFARQEDAPVVARTEVAPRPTLGFVWFDVRLRGYGTDQSTDISKPYHALWNATSQKVELQPLPQTDLPLYLLTARTYPNLRAVNDVPKPKCEALEDLQLLDAQPFARLVQGAYLLGALFVQRAQAETAMQALQQCDLGGEISVREHRAQ